MTAKNDSAPDDGLGLTLEVKKSLLKWCRDILSAKLEGNEIPPGPDLGQRKGGVFVTLKRKGRLRGCIGSFNFSASLSDSIREMVQAAGFNDYRFGPLAKEELNDLDITVSILTEPKALNSLDDLIIGRDGLYLIHPRGRGVLLPVVAVEQGWSAIEFASHTAMKAGLPPKAYKDPEAKLLVFTAPAFSTDSSENDI
ncbi:MAG: AmmeMemoRadiSam system protein A [Deltaproteobacteria bacterium]|jgi:AmmeMemoRadiSam system protein A|nr:AmmeMemoRadiSam system protein A [Deltaproteobacteria bacterium]